MSKLRMMRKKMQEKKGFTLIEMIIVIAIIAILIALIAPNLLKFLETSKQTKRDGAAKTLYTSAQAYVTEKELANDPVKVLKWEKGAEDFKKFEEDYFNVKEMANITGYTVNLNGDGVVTDVSVTMDNSTTPSVYPK